MFVKEEEVHPSFTPATFVLSAGQWIGLRLAVLLATGPELFLFRLKGPQLRQARLFALDPGGLEKSIEAGIQVRRMARFALKHGGKAEPLVQAQDLLLQQTYSAFQFAQPCLWHGHQSPVSMLTSLADITPEYKPD
jgi:hypothetical protein